MKEAGIQTAICQYLQYQENMGKLIYMRNNSGAVINQKGRFIKFGKRGSADIIIFVKGGKTLHVEIKNEKGRMSTSQLEMELKLKQLKHKYYLVRSVDEVELLLAKFI